MKKYILYPIWIFICVLGWQTLMGCTSEEKFDPEYGNSVRSIITVQTAATIKGGYGLDGEKALLSLKKYETDIADPKSIKNITISETAGKAISIGQ